MGCCAGGKKKKPNQDGRLLPGSHASVIDNPGRVREFYDFDLKRIGEGSFGTVFGCVNKSTGCPRAVKVCSKKNRRNNPKFLKEIAMMKSLDHPGIIKYYESFQDRKFIYIIMSLCEGDELFELTVKHGHLTEGDTAVIMNQVFRAVAYMHAVGVCHRDLKMENFMLYKDDGPIFSNTVRVIDFGLATRFDTERRDTPDPEKFSLKCGSPFYVSPQILCGSYDHMTDLWSVGVLMFTMLAGYPPFYGGNDAEVLARVRLGKFSFNSADWKAYTPDCKQVIRGLLKINPRDRTTGEVAVQSKWIKKLVPSSIELPLKNSLIAYLENFASANKLKRIGLYLIVSSLSDEELKPAVDSFNAIDVDGDGRLGFMEIHNGLIRAGISNIPSNLKEIFQNLDADGSGQIEFTEFLAATLDRKYITEENVWSLFRTFDQNGDGRISQIEMFRTLNLRCAEGEDAVTREEVVKLMREHSSEGDNYCTFPELYLVMTGGVEDESAHSHKKKKDKQKTRLFEE